MKRVVVVGPVSPFKGGIAQYTESLAAALGKRTDVGVNIVSFKRQYPRFLYPGESDRTPDARQLHNAEYIIDSNNPLTWIKAVGYINSLQPSLVLINWWTLFWQPGFALIAWRLRSKGTKVVFVCHNIYDHDASKFKQWLGKVMLRSADGYVVHDKEQQEILESFAPKNSILQRIHPVYDHFPAVEPKDIQLNDDRIQLLFAGLIRPYKGLDVLIDAYKQLDHKKFALTVVGECWDDKDTLLRNLNRAGIGHDLRFVSDYELGVYMSSADAVILPYRTATGSGVVNVAYHYGVPVIASSVGGLVEAVVDSKTGWLVEPGDTRELATCIAERVTKESKTKMKSAIDDYVKANSWGGMTVALTSRFMQDDCC